MQMEPHRLFGRGRLKIKDSVVQDVGYLDKHVSGDLCLRTYLIESGHDWICVNIKETCENININNKFFDLKVDFPVFQKSIIIF